MSGIVLELQREALSKDANIESLLRKAYVIAKKLKLKEFEDWIQLEQNGYGSREVPEYRYVQGQIKARNPYYGWIPVVLLNIPASMSLLSGDRKPQLRFYGNRHSGYGNTLTYIL